MRHRLAQLTLAIGLTLAPVPANALTREEITIEALHRAGVAFCHTRYTGESPQTSRIEALVAFVNYFAERMPLTIDNVVNTIAESEELQQKIHEGVNERVAMICPDQITGN